MSNAAARLLSTIHRLNPGIDVSGPVTDLFITPFASEVDELDARITVVKNMFSGEFDSSRSEEEILKIVGTRSISRDEGSYARGFISVRSATVPNNIKVARGSIVTTSDGLYQYLTAEDFAPTTSELEAGFNSAISQYEYLIPVRAIQIGTKYNIAATRLRTINVSLPAGCYITNTAAIAGGVDEQDLEGLWAEYKEAAVLADQSNRSGTARKLLKKFPALNSLYIKSDMAPPSPNGNSKPTILVYALGDTPMNVTASFKVSAAGVIELPSIFVSEILSVRRGAETIALYSLAAANLQLLEAYTPDEELVVEFTYNSLLDELQEYSNSLSTDLFGYRMVIRPGTVEDLKVRLQVRVQSGIIGSSAKEQIASVVLTHFNTLFFSDSDINQTDISTLLKNNLSGIISAKFLDLVVLSQTRQLTGFPLYLAPPKYARLLAANLEVDIKTS